MSEPKRVAIVDGWSVFDDGSIMRTAHLPDDEPGSGILLDLDAGGYHDTVIIDAAVLAAALRAIGWTVEPPR